MNLAVKEIFFYTFSFLSVLSSNAVKNKYEVNFKLGDNTTEKSLSTDFYSSPTVEGFGTSLNNLTDSFQAEKLLNLKESNRMFKREISQLENGKELKVIDTGEWQELDHYEIRSSSVESESGIKKEYSDEESKNRPAISDARIAEQYDKLDLMTDPVRIRKVHAVLTHLGSTDTPALTKILLDNAPGNQSLIETDGMNRSLIESQFRLLYPIALWKERGWFEDDYLHLINIHWLGFSPPPKAAHYTLAVLYICIVIVGCSGNCLVIFMFFKCRTLRTPANILVVNLAVSDLLMMAKSPIFIYNSFLLGPALGQLGCQIFGFVGGLTGTVSIGTLAAIAFDRYSVVVYPLEPLRSITGLRAKLSVLLVWLYGGFFASIPALDIGLGRYVPEGYLTSCGFDYLSEDKNHRIFIFCFFCAAWVLPFTIISLCYAKILKVVISTRAMGKITTGSISSRHCKEQEKNKTELKLAGIVICVIGLFFVAWTPYAIVSLMGITGYKNLIYPIVSMVPALFCKVASCIDPFIYVVTHPKFRQECENLLLCKKQRRRRSTLRQGWSVSNVTKVVQQEHEITSEDDVEVVEMGAVPYSNQDAKMSDESNSFGRKGLGLASVTPAGTAIDTVSTHTLTMGISLGQMGLALGSQLQPPSWFVKPQFVQRENSLKKVVKTFQRKKSQEFLS